MITYYYFFPLLLAISILPIKYEMKNKNQLFSKEETIILRGLAALFVITAHHQEWVANELKIITPPAFKYSIGQLGGIGVLIFFFLSGYGIHKSYNGDVLAKHYLTKRLIGVYIPYLIIKFLLLPGKYFFRVTCNSLLFEIKEIILINDWFILVIVLQYIIYYIASIILNKHIIIASIIANCIISYIFILLNKPIGWFNALWLFTIGIIASQYDAEIKQYLDNHVISFSLVALAGFIISGAMFAAYKGSALANIAKPISGACLCLLFAAMFKLISINSPILKWAGTRSMHIYVTHITVWECLLGMNNPIIRLFVSIIISAILSEILYIITNFITNKIKTSSIKAII